MSTESFMTVKIIVPDLIGFSVGPKPSSLVIGGLEFLRVNREEPYKPLPELSEKYGPIFLLRAGLLATTSVVVIAEPKV
jgi:hypothetical protein